MNFWKICNLFFAILLATGCNKDLQDETYTGKNKILMFIIASGDLPVYAENEKIWRAYMKSKPEHVEAYFIKSDPSLSSDHKMDGDTIWFKTEPGYAPASSGILDNLVMAFELWKDRLSEYSFVVRAGLSSFYVFDRLLRDSDNFPRSKFYGAVKGVYTNDNKEKITFGSGSNIMLSMDLVKLIIDNKSNLDGKLFDDVAIGKFLTDRGISVSEYPRVEYYSMNDWNKGKNSIPKNVSHFRVKNSDPDLRLHDDIFILNSLLNIFYNKSIK